MRFNQERRSNKQWYFYPNQPDFCLHSHIRCNAECALADANKNVPYASQIILKINVRNLFYMRLATLGQAKYPPRSITLLHSCPKEMAMETQNMQAWIGQLPCEHHGLKLQEHGLPDPYQNDTLCSTRKTVIKLKSIFSLMQTMYLRAELLKDLTFAPEAQSDRSHCIIMVSFSLRLQGLEIQYLKYITQHKWFKNSKSTVFPCYKS